MSCKKRENESGFPLSPLLFQILNVAANGLCEKKEEGRGQWKGEKGAEKEVERRMTERLERTDIRRDFKNRKRENLFAKFKKM